MGNSSSNDVNNATGAGEEDEVPVQDIVATWPVDETGSLTPEFAKLPSFNKVQRILTILNSLEPAEEERPIDYVLAYPVPQVDNPDDELTKGRRREELKHREYRDTLLAILQHMGLHVKEVISEDENMVYCHLYAPMPLLVTQAEKIKMKWELSRGLIEEDDEDDEAEGLYCFSGDFTVARYCQFYEFYNTRHFFTPAQRALLTRQMIDDARFYKPKKWKRKFAQKLLCCGVDGNDHDTDDDESDQEEEQDLDDEPEEGMKAVRQRKYGIAHLVRQGAFSAAFPLHTTASDAELEEYKDMHIDDVPVVARNYLLRHWAFNFWRAQPLEAVRRYFGEKICLYFTWLGFYSMWLWLPAIGGVIVAIAGLAGPAGMESSLTIPFAVLMALWSTLFLEYWKRKNVKMSYLWDMMHYENEERVRAEFYGVWRESPVTGELELYYPRWKRNIKYLVGGLSMVVMVLVVVIAAVAVLLYRAINTGTIHGIFAGFLNACSIFILNFVYGMLAQKLNEWENHRTETEFEDSLITKTFLFQFVNSYITLFYIAFFKSNATIFTQFGLPADECKPNCLSELSSQLGAILITKQIIGNVKEVLIPYVKYRAKLAKENREAEEQAREEAAEQAAAEGESAEAVPIKRKKTRLPPWETEMQLPDFPGTFNEYNEMIIQFGYVTLFVAAFPLAPLAALVNNLIEIRSDAFKLCVSYRRPTALMAQDMGTWFKILEVVSIIAVLTNTLVISFTSTMLPLEDCGTGDSPCRNMWRFWVFIILEHCLLLGKFVLARFIPDVSETVQLAIEKENFQMRKAAMAAQGAGEINFDEDLHCYDPDDDESFAPIKGRINMLHSVEVNALYPTFMGGDQGNPTELKMGEDGGATPEM